MEIMKPEEQRIAIAKACGFTIESDGITHCLTPCDFSGNYNPEGKLLKKVPDYLNDLNAMHEAVISKLNGPAPDGWMFIDNLRIACEIPQSNTCMALVCATAAQRAEAFLRTIGKWVEL